MTAIILYSIALSLLIISLTKSKTKTVKSLSIAKRSFLNMLPTVLGIMFIIGIVLALLNPERISQLLGQDSGIKGIIIALIVGAVAAVPSFVAFPLGGTLIDAGAGYPQVAALVMSLMAIGFISVPLEIKYFNKKITYLRMGLSFLICICFTFVIWMVM